MAVYSCGGCGQILQAKKRKNDTEDTPQRKPEEDSSGKQKMEQVSDDQKPSSSTNYSINEPDRKTSDHNDLDISSEILGQDEDTAKKEEICMVDSASDGVKEYSSGKQKMEQDVSMDEVIDGNNLHNDPRSSTELSGHGDPESSPEARAHNRKDQNRLQEQEEEQDQDQDVAKSRSRSRSPEAAVHDSIDKDREPIDGDLKICKNEVEFEESSRELTTSSEKSSYSELENPSRKAIGDTKIGRDFNRGSRSSFKNMIAEKLLDTRQKKVVYMDEDDILSDDESADLHHRRRFNRISSEETLQDARFGGRNYDYEGSVSSFDGTDNQFSTKKQLDSGNEYHHHQKHRREFHSSKSRRGKDEQHRSMEFQPFYGNTTPSRHRPPAIPNPKMERLELLKMVRELQDQLERTNVSHSAQLPPSYYDHGLNHPGRYGHRMAFSGETTAVNNRRDDGSGICHRCFPQERHFSSQLPRPHVCCNGPHYVPSTCYSSESDFSAPVMVKPNPNEHRRRIDVPKPYNSPKKQYVRPISGGSPWISCYRCSEVLQLPQSFLVTKKRCHSLRCGACEKVITYTVSDGTHVHRYYPEETMVAPPSSEVEEYSDARAGPVSCSDRSFQKSYSTETDRNGYWGFHEEKRKTAMSRDPSSSSGPSSSRASGRRRAVSEIEEVEPANNSPLHWLMGYASPSKVIRG